MSFNVSFIPDIVKVRESGDNMIPVDIQGIDVGELMSRGENVPVEVNNRDVFKQDFLQERQIRDREPVIARINMDRLLRMKDFEIFFTNRLDVDVEIFFKMDAATYNLACFKEGNPYDITVRPYFKESGGLVHTLPAGTSYVKLSDIPPVSETGSIAVDRAPFKKMWGQATLDMHIIAKDTPTSGSVKAYWVGVPN